MTDDKKSSSKSSPRKSGTNNTPNTGGRRVATDDVVDQYGSPVGVPEDKAAVNARDSEQTVGATGPTNWWRIGVIVLVVLVAILIILQIATGGSMAPTEAPPPS